MKIYEIDMSRYDLKVELKDDIAGTVRSKHFVIEGKHSVDIMRQLHSLYDSFQPDFVYVESSGVGILPYEYFSNIETVKPKLRKMIKRAW